MRDSYATEETHVGSHTGEPVVDKYGHTAAVPGQQTGHTTTTQTYQPYTAGAARNTNGTF